MPSWQARLASFLVRRRVRPALGDMSDLARVRAVFDSPLPVPRGVRMRGDHLGGVPGEWVEAASAAPDDVARPIVLYVHGGGFVGGSPRSHRPVTAGLALRGLEVFAPAYRLAPEHPFPAALDDLLAVWRALATRYRGRRLVVAGDSAGGNLALALMAALREAAQPLPAAAALFSPSTDLAGGSASLHANTGRDPMFDGPALAHLAHAYLGTQVDAADARVSPLRGSLQGLPPLLVHVASGEVLRDDGLRLAAKAREADVHVELAVWDGVPHAWQLLARLPEARRSLDAAAAFLREAGTGGPPVLDSVIVGAGLSGIGMAVHLQRACPGHRYALLESREALGGTWDLFRYPGVRSDSDMLTLGYRFKPWRDPRTIADGGTLREYLRAAAAEHGIDLQVRFGHRVVAASWDSRAARWTLTVERGAAQERIELACRFLFACSGYYRYDAGHDPGFAGRSDFRGEVVHPQFWPPALDVAGRQVVVIGSGATAVTLVPALARTAAHVTMLQRSPSYFLALPSRDGAAGLLPRLLPQRLAYALVRAKNIVGGQLLFAASRRWPARMRSWLIGRAARAVPAVDAARHLAPRYDPWEQRLCIVPDGDLFKALAGGRAEIVTDTLEHFTATGLKLASGRELPADLVVTATGLKLQVLGGMAVQVDGKAVDFSQAMTYKGLMFGGVPNLVYTFGYTNASWTLRAELTAEFACRLLRHMARRGWQVATPRPDQAEPPRPFVDFSSGYFQRDIDRLPRQGTRAPWRLSQSYFADLFALRWGRIEDGVLGLERAQA